MNKFNLGLRGHDIADTFDAMCALAEENNVRKLQFALAKTLSDVNFFETGFNDDLADRVADKLLAHNLEVSVLGCYINPVGEDDELRNKQLKMFESFIRYAKKFSAGGIATETGQVKSLSYTHSEENYQSLLKNMSPLIRLAEEIDVNVYIEPVSIFTIHSPWIMKRMIDDVGSKNLNVILDISNIMTEENISEQEKWINESFDILGDRIKVVHMKDFVIEASDKKTVMLGSGILNIPLLLKRALELPTTPDIILDETPLRNFEASCKVFEEIYSKIKI